MRSRPVDCETVASYHYEYMPLAGGGRDQGAGLDQLGGSTRSSGGSSPSPSRFGVGSSLRHVGHVCCFPNHVRTHCSWKRCWHGSLTAISSANISCKQTVQVVWLSWEIAWPYRLRSFSPTAASPQWSLTSTIACSIALVLIAALNFSPSS